MAEYEEYEPGRLGCRDCGAEQGAGHESWCRNPENPDYADDEID